MAKTKREEEHEALRKRILYAAAKSFLEEGYDASTLRGIAVAAKTTYGSIQYLWPTKEDLLCELVRYVLEGQFQAAAKFLQGKAEDPLLFYAAETTLQLYMAESSEQIRNLYSAAYGMPKSAKVIQVAIAQKLETMFSAHLPELKLQDFYMLELASGGVMRSFMTVPCDMWFTIELKVQAFLTATFRIYQVPEAKIDEAVAFVRGFDYPTLARQTVDTMLAFLARQTQ